MSVLPRVSVIVPNYNYAHYLVQRLDSIFNQTVQDFELIYLDDASTDDSAAVFARYADDSRVRAFYNEKNGGNVFRQWNKGVREARGQYIWLAEADDFADPHLLEALLSRLENDPQVGLAYSSSQVVDENGAVVERAEEWLDHLDPQRWLRDFRNNGLNECSRYLLHRNTIFNASAVVFRRDVYEKIGYAEESYRLSGDWITWIRMLLRSDIAYLCEPLNFFRKHSQTVRSQVDHSALRILENYRIVEEIIGSTKVDPQDFERVCNSLVEEWAKAVLPQKQAAQRHYNHDIYQVARRIDPRLNSRLAKRGLSFLTERLNTRLTRLSSRSNSGKAEQA